MAYSSNTSQFVKTYGKPRHTQRLVQDSLWYENITDDFDKCLGIEDVQKTTFISPEPAGSVTVHNYTKHKTKTKNKMNTIGRWSMHLQSTLSGHKSKTIKNRNFEHSSDDCYNKKNLLLENTEKKKTNNNCRKIYSNSSSILSTDSNNLSNLKVTSTIKKPNKKFILPRDQCSTPFQRTIFAHGKQLNNISSKKKKKINKSRINFICTLNDTYTPTLSKKPEYSHLNSSNLKVKEIKKYNQLEESVLISGSHCLLPSKKQQNSKHKSIQSTIGNKHRKHRTQVFKKPSRSSNYKKNKFFNNSKEGNSNWYKDVMTIFNEEKAINLEKSLEKDNFESVKINYKTTNVVTKPLENRKESSLFLKVNNKLLQPMKDTKNSSSEEDDHDGNVNFNKSKKHNSYKNNIVKTKDKTIIEKLKLDELYDEDSSNLFNDSLYVSCYEFTKDKVTEHIESPSDPCINSINVSMDNKFFVDKALITNSKSPQQNQISSYKKSLLNSLCNNINESCTNSYNKKSLSILEQNTNNKSSDFVNFNQSQHTSVNENISLQSSNNELFRTAHKSNPQIFLDVTEKFSDITIDDKVERYDELSNLSHNKSSFNNSVSNNSSLILDGSSASKLGTIIYKQNHSNVFFKENSDYNNLSLNKKDVDFLKTSCVCYSKNNNLKCDDISNDTNSSSNKIIFLNKENNVLCNNSQNELFNSSSSYITSKEKSSTNFNESNGLLNESKNIYSHFEDISCIKYEKQTTTENPTNMYNNIFDEKFEETTNTQNISRRKRYAERFQNINMNSIEEYSHQDSNGEIQNSTHKYLDYTQSILSHQNVSGFRLEPGKKWRRSILIVRNYIDGNLDQTTDFAPNTAKGRKWISTVDDVLQKQSINNSMYQKLDHGNIFRSSICCSSERYLKNSFTENELAKKSIFEICNQEKLISFESWLELKVKKPWKKVGEGVYGEVFSYACGKNNTVVKIIPIEGETKINSEQQKKMFEVYSEIFIATKLNKLFDNDGRNYTKSFCKLRSISCVYGKYPKHLIRLWSEYNNNKGSDNDNPNILPDTQIFMVLEMEDGGIDVENFLFNSASQALFAFLQIVFGLAVAEQQYDFEHRDLHIGNILVKKISSKTQISYKLDGEVFNIPSHGVKMTIIDFTLSRMTHYNKPIYNNLAEDPEMFASYGDYQFEIYRLMRKETNDQWSLYKPKTNIYWLHYVLDKMLTSIHYKKVSTAVHHIGLSNLLKIKNSVLLFDSAKHFSQSSLILDLIN